MRTATRIASGAVAVTLTLEKEAPPSDELDGAAEQTMPKEDSTDLESAPEIIPKHLLDDPIEDCLRALEKKYECDREEAIRIVSGRLGMETSDLNRRAIFYALEREDKACGNKARDILKKANAEAAARGETPLYQVEIMQTRDAYDDAVERIDRIRNKGRFSEFLNENIARTCLHAARVAGHFLQTGSLMDRPWIHEKRVASELVGWRNRVTKEADAEDLLRRALISYGCSKEEGERLRNARSKRRE